MPERPIIWYADDDEDDRLWLKEALQRDQPKAIVVLFEHGKDLLQYASTCNSKDLPQLIVLDLNMPYLNGLEVFHALRTDDKFEPVKIAIFTTAPEKLYTYWTTEKEVLFLTKPFNSIQTEKAATTFLSYACETA